jgi:hypothetical protein
MPAFPSRDFYRRCHLNKAATLLRQPHPRRQGRGGPRENPTNTTVVDTSVVRSLLIRLNGAGCRELRQLAIARDRGIEHDLPKKRGAKPSAKPIDAGSAVPAQCSGLASGGAVMLNAFPRKRATNEPWNLAEILQ